MRIVPIALARPSLAPRGLLSVKLNWSASSGVVSPMTATAGTDDRGSAIAVRGIDARAAAPVPGSELDQLGSYLAFADLHRLS